MSILGMPTTPTLTTALLAIIAVLIAICAGLGRGIIAKQQGSSLADAFQQAACAFGVTLTLCFVVMSAVGLMPRS